MKKHMEYLKDTDIERLIREIEQNELVSAPPDLQDQIMKVLNQDMHALEERKARDKVTEYKRYRFRVMTTVAAAVMVVFLLPKLESLQQQEVEEARPLTKHEIVMKSRYETKEDALNDNGMLESMLGGVNIFADNSRWNFFRE